MTTGPEQRDAQAQPSPRDRFPRGLQQPGNGYRFSMDALLLAAFAARALGGSPGGRTRHVLDLGTGCGVVGIGFLLARQYMEQAHAGWSFSGETAAAQSWQVVGVERLPELFHCAVQNIQELGVDEQFTPVLSDVAEYNVANNTYDAVISNPPFRALGRGRACPSAGRDAARFEDAKGPVPFFRAARAALRDKAPFYLVHLPERLPELFCLARDMGLEPKRMRLVHGHGQAEARMVLLEMRKNAGSGLRVEPPLQLYHGHGPDRCLTREALAFCPFLQCNAEKRGAS
ncbi:tRNA1(Val) A37 N6-methylase TrmN6 [Paucidesulfovibrio gracilis DSM 16080]|uniref:tRNA1(Val) A37 N6-methylase TrmN6 n=1 Tax=Paucidesulfovibrio gracilis DSM 16080 TaxID=1121449 RepID=A0A1T4XUC2_9BACT|nr:hypothetical protein [Paucidesulfovibrio gracilis]SKA92685.1 tRNA1(Val) A37 N6-methylase TrmN6 [Paucidesulfovibrio gracilis DSM 16080]